MAIDSRIMVLIEQLKQVSSETANTFVIGVTDNNGTIVLSQSERAEWLICHALSLALARRCANFIDGSFAVPPFSVN